MTEEQKKSRYNEAQRRATLKYRQERGQIMITTTKANKERITQAAKDAGLSVNQYILNKIFG